jgi:hypothetical protein
MLQGLYHPWVRQAVEVGVRNTAFPCLACIVLHWLGNSQELLLPIAQATMFDQPADETMVIRFFGGQSLFIL